MYCFTRVNITAQVAKSVDARDLKSLGLCRAGSSPALGTNKTSQEHSYLIL